AVERGPGCNGPEWRPAQRHGAPARPERRGKEPVVKDALGHVQSVLVLGGGSDIARATCRKLVEQRAPRVVLAAREPETCDTGAAELKAAGASEVHTVAFDATDLSSHE